MNIINLAGVNSQFLYNRAKDVDFNVTLALMQHTIDPKLKDVLKVKKDYTIYTNGHGSAGPIKGGFIDLRQLE